MEITALETLSPLANGDHHCKGFHESSDEAGTRMRRTKGGNKIVSNYSSMRDQLCCWWLGATTAVGSCFTIAVT